MRALVGVCLLATATVAAAVTPPFVRIAGTPSGMSDTCGGQSTMTVPVDLAIPTGGSYRYEIGFTYVPTMTNDMMMDMMMGSGMYDPVLITVYQSPAVNGPV